MCNSKAPLTLDNWSWIEYQLAYLSCYDAKDIDCDEFEMIAEDEQGNEGCLYVSVVDLAKDASEIMRLQHERIRELEEALKDPENSLG